MKRKSIKFFIKHYIIYTIIYTISIFNVLYAQKGASINKNGSPPDKSAILDISSTTKGMLVPRMTYSQRTDPSSFNNNNPAQSIIVYQTDSLGGYPEGYYFYSINNSPHWTFLTNSSQVQQNSLNYSADNGIANTYQINLSPAPANYTEGMLVSFKAKNANTGSSTLTLNSLSYSPAIKKRGGTKDLDSGDISAGQIITVVYDGTNFQIILCSSLKGKIRNNLIYSNDGF